VTRFDLDVRSLAWVTPAIPRLLELVKSPETVGVSHRHFAQFILPNLVPIWADGRTTMPV